MEYTYAYDRENRLVEVTKADRDDDEAHEAEMVRLAYDGLGRRLVRERVEEGHDEDHDEATRVEYLFDGLDPVAEYDVDRGSWRYDDRGALGRIVSSRRGPADPSLGSLSEGHEALALQVWYLYDGLGSVVGLTDGGGRLLERRRYAPYGRLLGEGELHQSPYAFVGKAWEEELGLYYFGARHYDPGVGVWLTQEPLPGERWRPRTWHRYAYAFANPVNYYDLYGLAVPSGTGGGGVWPPPPPPPEPVPTPPPGTPTPWPGGTPVPPGPPGPTPVPVPAPTPWPTLTPTPMPKGAQCVPQNLGSWWRNRQKTAEVLSKTALAMDATAFVLSGIEAVVTDVAAVAFIGGFAALGAGAGGIGIGPGALLGLEFAVALDFAIAGGSWLGQAENILGGTAFFATFLSDVAAGYTGFTDEGFAVGQDTLVSARNMLLGFFPESNIDFAISASQLNYDIQRNFGGKPGGSVVFSGLDDWESWKELLHLVFLEHWR